MTTATPTISVIAILIVGVLAWNAFGVKYLRYWVDERSGRIFCLVEAPDAETANTVHREAHGLVADAIFELQEGS